MPGPRSCVPRAPLLAPLLPPGIVAIERDAGSGPVLRDFDAGRRCAALAAAEFGFDGSAIGKCADHRPDWPAGFTGSITHTEGFAAAAMGRRDRFSAIGIDIERTGRVTPELWGRIMNRSELDWIHGLPAGTQGAMATVVFSAKEAFYKAQFELVQQWLEFHDVSVDFAAAAHPGTLAIVPMTTLWVSRHWPDPVPVRYAFDRFRVATALAMSAH